MRSTKRGLVQKFSKFITYEDETPMFPGISYSTAQYIGHVKIIYDRLSKEGYRDEHLRVRLLIELSHNRRIYKPNNPLYNNLSFNPLIVPLSRETLVQMLNNGETQEFLKIYRQAYISEEIDDQVSPELLREFHALVHQVYFEYYGIWGMLPDFEQVQKVREFIGDRFTLDVGSGSGLHSLLFKSAGIDIVATDPGYEKYPAIYLFTDRYTSYDALRVYFEAEVLMSSWPRGWPTSQDLKIFDGDRVVLIGEPPDVTSFGVFNVFFDGTEDSPMFKSWELVDILKIEPAVVSNEIIALFQRKK